MILIKRSDINKKIDTLKVIGWVKAALKEVTSDTIMHCFKN